MPTRRKPPILILFIRTILGSALLGVILLDGGASMEELGLLAKIAYVIFAALVSGTTFYWLICLLLRIPGGSRAPRRNPPGHPPAEGKRCGIPIPPRTPAPLAAHAKA